MPGIGTVTGECWSSQASATCAGVAPCGCAISAKRAARLGQLAGGEREPGQECDPGLLAEPEHVLGGAVADVVVVLDRDDRHDLLGALDLLDVDVGEADVADLALVLELGQRADRVLDRHLRVDRVQLVEVDPLELQPPQRVLAAALEPLRPAVRLPPSRARAARSPPLVAITRSSG